MEKLKKGKYYIGDPCYIFKENWIKVLEQADYFQYNEVVKVFNKECCAGGTAYGDGSYFDKQGRKYWVDSGLIGILPVSLISKDKKTTVSKIQKSEGMHIVEFKEDFEVLIDNGRFHFGDIIIDTLDDEDYNY